MNNLFETPCPCCVSPVFLTLFACTFSLYLLTFQSKKRSKLAGYLCFFSFSTSLILCLIFGALIAVPDLRNRFFAKWFAVMSKTTTMDPVRCPPIANLHGKILEIGPGAGGSFRCWANSTSITSWVGIEVNKYFAEPIEQEAARWNISFPRSINWIGADGSGIDIEDETFDAVVATHVLCSVDNIPAVLATVARALKPGASYYFLEHVAANASQASYSTWQDFTAPLISIIGNNCHFKQTDRALQTAVQHGPMLGYSLDMERFEAPIGLPPLKPHIKGRITKPVV